MKKIFIFGFFILITLLLFKTPILTNQLPISGDIIIGHYHPWADYIWDHREAGYPYKNFQLSDSILQLYPWREFSIQSFKKHLVPLWNPYNLTGMPHLANLPTASLYPINIIFFILSFPVAWTIYLAMQTVLGGFFMYLFLKQQKLTEMASIFGGIIFVNSSFIINRYYYGITGHTWIWIPLTLYAITRHQQIKTKSWLSHINRWWLLIIFSSTMTILAGYLQGIIYGYGICLLYLFLYHRKKSIKTKLISLSALVIPIFISAVQLIPFLEVIFTSSRIHGYNQQPEAFQYFFPLQNLITIIAPDYFGNPSTHNFWGITSYQEFAIYIGIVPLFFALYILNKKNKYTTTFWIIILTISILFITDNPISRYPYQINLPLYKSLLPSRINSIFTLALGILSAYGFSNWQQKIQTFKGKKNPYPYALLLFFILILILIWEITTLSPAYTSSHPVISHLKIAQKNLILPSLYILSTSVILLLSNLNIHIINRYKNKLLPLILISITLFDLLRQAYKYNTFIKPELVLPPTKSISYLQSQSPPPRIMVSHSELFPANINLHYGISFLNSYDSVHPQRTEILLSALNGESNNMDKVNTNRNTYAYNYLSTGINLFSPQYLLTYQNEITSPQFNLIITEGNTRLYQNIESYPRTYLTKNIYNITNDQEIINKLLLQTQKKILTAITKEPVILSKTPLNPQSEAKIIEYQANQVTIQTQSNTDAFLVFNDNYYPGWKAYIDQQPQKIYLTNYTFRGITVPEGRHKIIFKYQPKSFRIGLNITLVTITIIILLIILKKRQSINNFRTTKLINKKK